MIFNLFYSHFLSIQYALFESKSNTKVFQGILKS